MQANLSYLTERQDVLSQNIANANVPNYKAKDLKPMDFSDYMAGGSKSTVGVQLANTEPGHIAGTGNASNSTAAKAATKSFEVTPTGNSVVVEDEVLKMSKNNLEYQQTADLYKKMLEMIKTAIGNA